MSKATAKKTKNYRFGKVYKVINDVDDMVYIGSTTQKYLSQRMSNHRQCARLDNSSLMYQHMRRVGIEHFKIVFVENVPCDHIYELASREEHWRQQVKSELRLNMIAARQTQQTHDESRARSRDYNKLPMTCDCGAQITKNSLSRHRRSKKHIAWAVENKCVVVDVQRYDKTKSKKCECGGCYTTKEARSSRLAHTFTKKHQMWCKARAFLFFIVLQLQNAKLSL